jgi:hypothetical protein
VPICCGADVFATSNYELKQLEISVFEGNEVDHTQLGTRRYAHQRTVDQFKLATIKPDRALHRDPAFSPEWPWLDAVKARHRHTIALDEREAKLLEEIKRDPEFFGLSEAEIVRFCFFRWYALEHMQGPKQLKT